MQVNFDPYSGRLSFVRARLEPVTRYKSDCKVVELNSAGVENSRRNGIPHRIHNRQDLCDSVALFAVGGLFEWYGGGKQLGRNEIWTGVVDDLRRRLGVGWGSDCRLQMRGADRIEGDKENGKLAAHLRPLGVEA